MTSHYYHLPDVYINRQAVHSCGSGAIHHRDKEAAERYAPGQQTTGATFQGQHADQHLGQEHPPECWRHT